MFDWLSSMFDVTKPYQKSKVITLGGGVACLIFIFVMVIYFDIGIDIPIISILAVAMGVSAINK